MKDFFSTIDALPYMGNVIKMFVICIRDHHDYFKGPGKAISNA